MSTPEILCDGARGGEGGVVTDPGRTMREVIRKKTERVEKKPDDSKKELDEPKHTDIDC